MHGIFNNQSASRISLGEDEREWLSLWSLAPDKHIFNHPSWLRALGTIQQCLGHKIWFAVSTNGDSRLTGVWPFVVRRGTAKDFFATIIEPLGAESTDYIAPLVSESQLDSLLQVTVEFIKTESRWDSIVSLPKLKMSGKEVDYITEKFSALGWYVQKRDRTIWRMRFLTSWEEQTKAWSSNHRGDVGRRLRRLQEKGDLELFVAASREDVLANFNNMFEKHQSKWAAAGVMSEFRDKSKRDLYVELVKSLPFDHIHYSEVRLSGQAISYHFGFLDDGWLLWYKPAYDIDYENYSPGKVHIALLTKNGIEVGMKGIDFLQGDEGYKRLWSNDSVTTTSLLLAPKSAFIQFFWQTAYRKKIRDVVFLIRKKILIYREQFRRSHDA